MSVSSFALTEQANREYASNATRRLNDRVETLLEKIADSYEPETDSYINGKLTIIVEIKVIHEPYERNE